MPADGQAVTITELGAPFRVMTFAGRDRPEKPVTVAGEQRSVQSHYPGTQRASVQVLGTKEDPIVLRGWFQDPLNALDGGAAVRIATLRGMKQAGNHCRLVWGDVIVRLGRVKRVEFEFHESERVRYTVTFEVDQAGEPVAFVPTPTGAALGDLKAALAKARDVTGQALEAARAILALQGVVR